jgi:hypothetical protein
MQTSHRNDYSDEIECGQCGASFYYELHRCPECGALVYPDEADEPSEPSRAAYSLMQAGPLLLSWFTSALLLLVLYFPLSRAFSLDPLQPGARLLLLLTAALCALPAGWLAGRYASSHLHAHGLLAGLGTASLAVVFFELVYNQGAELLESPTSWAVLLLVVLAGWGGSRLAEHMHRQSAVASLFGPVIEENLHYQRLLAITGNDKETVERLIAYEGRRYPKSTRLERMQRAIERWERDNR